MVKPAYFTAPRRRAKQAKSRNAKPISPLLTGGYASQDIKKWAEVRRRRSVWKNPSPKSVTNNYASNQ